MPYVYDYEEGLNNAMLRAKIEYIAKTRQVNGCMGNDIEELQIYKNNITDLKKYLKYLGFKIVREYEADGKWIEINKNICISEDGFVTSYPRKKVN